jgi:hypothetical protein
MSRYMPSPPQRSSLWTSTWLFGLLALIVVVAVFVLPALALGQTAGASPDDLGQLVNVAIQALKLSGPGRWFGLLFVGVIAGVWVLRKLFGTRDAKGQPTSRLAAFVLSDEGGTVLNLFVTAIGTLLAKVLVGSPLTWPVAAAAFLAAAGGTGGLWSHARRLLRLVTPLVARIPGVGPSLAKVLDVLSGARAKAEIAAKTDAAYKPLSPGPTAAQAADALSKPPVA